METLNKLIAGSRAAEVNTVGSKMIIGYEKNDWSSDAHLTTIFDLLKARNDALTGAINRIKAESDLEEKDEVRDEKVRAIYYLILGYTHYPDLTIKTAAVKIDAIFEHYGLEIITKSYSVESSFIESLLLEFTNPDIQSSIDALPGLRPLITELTDAELDFKTASVAFDNEKGKEGTQESATKIKLEVVNVINEKIVVYLRAMIQVNEPTYGELTRTIAETIEENNIIVKKRKKKAEPLA